MFNRTGTFFRQVFKTYVLPHFLKRIDRDAQHIPVHSKRTFLKYGIFSFATLGFIYGRLFSSYIPRRYLRPPGAIDESAFLKKCVRCNQCSMVCPNQCIKPFGLGTGKYSGTPHIIPREQGCILCMKCNNTCPSGALRPVQNDIAEISDKVNMGVAVIDEDLCFSYNDRICGVCYRACPLQDVAITIGPWERPKIVKEKCVGCGLCERICYHYPQAVRVIPDRTRTMV